MKKGSMALFLHDCLISQHQIGRKVQTYIKGPFYENTGFFMYPEYDLDLSRNPHYFWSIVNQKVKVTEIILKMAPFKKSEFFCIPNVIRIFPQICSILPLVRPYSYKKINKNIFSLLWSFPEHKQTNKCTQKHNSWWT